MKKRCSEEQIIGFLREADAGLPIKELCRKHGFSNTCETAPKDARGLPTVGGGVAGVGAVASASPSELARRFSGMAFEVVRHGRPADGPHPHTDNPASHLVVSYWATYATRRPFVNQLLSVWR